ncbi:hypothetical protein MVES_001982 [Malassezia vespertilionis]|uniref:CTLH domain-containing protein n=2 Tax=Malassezia vespertilionis TaxID=2020962 RepID=A0A2N1JCB5_9BASI|nr:hypothetical protein MVES_001982 [Malassezia vespertilionis]
MVSREEWEAQLADIRVPKEELDKLLMDFFIVEGYKEAAEQFSLETGHVPEVDLPNMQLRIDMRDKIMQGDVLGAIELVNEMNPEILDTSPRIFFHLQQLRMIELLREGNSDKALSFTAEQLAPLGEEHPHLLGELEQTMALFVFDVNNPALAGVRAPPYVEALYSIENRRSVADELNAAVRVAQSYSNAAKLLLLLQLAQLGEQLLGSDGPGRTQFPTLDIHTPLALTTTTHDEMTDE